MAAYRHVGNNAKIGMGYEFGNVSDDLTDINYSNQGLFLNLIAKFSLSGSDRSLYYGGPACLAVSVSSGALGPEVLGRGGCPRAFCARCRKTLSGLRPFDVVRGLMAPAVDPGTGYRGQVLGIC